MDIKQVLEHPWIQKMTKAKITEQRRNSKDQSVSTFKIYTSVCEENEEKKNK